jgi:hypothetical protein
MLSFWRLPPQWRVVIESNCEGFGVLGPSAEGRGGLRYQAARLYRIDQTAVMVFVASSSNPRRRAGWGLKKYEAKRLHSLWSTDAGEDR